MPKPDEALLRVTIVSANILGALSAALAQVVRRAGADMIERMQTLNCAFQIVLTFAYALLKGGESSHFVGHLCAR